MKSNRYSIKLLSYLSTISIAFDCLTCISRSIEYIFKAISIFSIWNLTPNDSIPMYVCVWYEQETEILWRPTRRVYIPRWFMFSNDWPSLADDNDKNYNQMNREYKYLICVCGSSNIKLSTFDTTSLIDQTNGKTYFTDLFNWS